MTIIYREQNYQEVPFNSNKMVCFSSVQHLEIIFVNSFDNQPGNAFTPLR